MHGGRKRPPQDGKTEEAGCADARATGNRRYQAAAREEPAAHSAERRRPTQRSERSLPLRRAASPLTTAETRADDRRFSNPLANVNVTPAALRYSSCLA